MARVLTDDERTIFNRMLRTIRSKRRRNQLRTDYMEMERKLDKLGFSIPPHMQSFQTAIGWPAKAVRVPVQRVRPDGYRLKTRSELLDKINETLQDPYVQMLERAAIESAGLHSCAFMFVTKGDQSQDEPELVFAARSAIEATAETDMRTGRVTAALEIVSKSEMYLFLPGWTLQLERVGSGRDAWQVTHEYKGEAGFVPCVPYRWGFSLEKPFGTSLMTNAVMGHTDAATRTLLRGEVNAEFYSAPRAALMGADEAHFQDAKGNRVSPLDAMIGGVWGVPDTYDEEVGELQRADLKFLPQASQQPHNDQLRAISMMIAADTGIPVSYFGIIQDNPASADAIRAAEAELVSRVEDQLKPIGAARRMLAEAVIRLTYGEFSDTARSTLKSLRPDFLSPATLTKSVQADTAQKFVAAFPWAAESDTALEMFGLDIDQIDRLKQERQRVLGAQRLELLSAAARGTDTSAGQGEQTSLRDRADALGVLRRAGVTADSAARLAGLEGVEFIEGDPITIRTGD
ncbi:phage portal protein [Zhihengliuella flava]|uniref:Phage portal protein n=1 Tax=Zhihengliuella flava TaxID=1285193 RepID=A0A931D752_9MICC|nr:phage portal protein [Zhihengliuella flava]MBG6083248.1 hypothetical protein [Zhihengliuella flava]